MRKGVIPFNENKIVEKISKAIILDNIPNIPRYIGNHKYKYFTNMGRRFKVIYAHAGYPWLWEEVGF